MKAAGAGAAILGALWAAALSTFGDFVWARFISSHRPLFGLLHGTALFLAIGAWLGVLRRRPLGGARFGALVGLAAAASYYALAWLLGYGAMFVSWMALWVGFAFVHGRALGPPHAETAAILARGAVAAVASGLAFYAISGIWTRPRPGGPDYAYNFMCWTIAFLPGFLALLVRRPRGS